MKRYLLYIFFIFCTIQIFAQTDTIYTSINKSKSKPYLDYTNNKIILRNEHATLGRKIMRASAFVVGMEVISGGTLILLPEDISKWDRTKFNEYRQHYINAFTKTPVCDDDYWYINYIGHPYQGAYAYNGLRSQGATMLQSSLFATAHSFAWEYLLEAGAEQPSLQDIIVTPLGGIIWGEMAHKATMRMSKKGFRWYEKIFVLVFNPAFAYNNGFRKASKLNKEF